MKQMTQTDIKISFDLYECETIKEALMNFSIYMLRLDEDHQNAWDNINYGRRALIALQIIRKLNDSLKLNYNESGNPSKSSSTSPEGK